MIIKNIKLLIILLVVIFLIVGCANKNKSLYTYTPKHSIEDGYSAIKNIKLFQAAYRGDLNVFIEMLNSGADSNQLVSQCDFKPNIRECDKNYASFDRYAESNKKTIIDVIFDRNPIKHKIEKENSQLNINMLKQVSSKLTPNTIRHYYLNNRTVWGSDFWSEEFTQKHQLLLSRYSELNGWSEQQYINLGRLYNYRALPFETNQSQELKERALNFLQLYIDKVTAENGLKYEDELLINAIKYPDPDMKYDAGSYIHFMTIKNTNTTVSNYKDIFNQEKQKFLAMKEQKEKENKNQLILDYNNLLKNKKIHINNVYSVNEVDKIKKSQNENYYFNIGNNIINKINNKLRFTNTYNSTGMILASVTTSSLEEFTNKVLSQVTTQLILNGHRKLNTFEEIQDTELDDNSLVIVEVNSFNKKLQKKCTNSNLDRIFQSDENSILNYPNANCYKQYILDNSRIKKFIIINDVKSIVTNIIEIDE